MLRRTVRGFASLVAGVLVGPVALFWVVVTTVICSLLSITYLGPPVFVPVTWVTRRIAGGERRRAGWVLGRRVAAPYETVSTRNPWTSGRALARQAATWRDLAWLVLLFPLGTGIGLIGTIAALVTTGMALAPLWLGFVPNPNAPPGIDFFVNTVPGLLLLVPIGLSLTPLSAWLVRRISMLQATIAEQLLGPGPRQRLADRAVELADTRRRVVDAQAAELQRIERDLHDGAQARIVAAGMTLALTERRLRTAVPEDDPVQQGVRTARRQLDDALAELRRLVRGIHPPILTDRGLAAALVALAGDAPMPVTIDAADAGRLPAAVESAAYFVVAEALANAAKHSAASECAVVVRRTPERLQVEVRDDGRGGTDPAGSGLVGLRRRVEALDGTLTITSPPGGPTVVLTELPCAS
ncbi:sensor histidine kinase [Kribbella sp. NPDC051586]|uniref:sensor histidine kinase n=1 Tax=Kribbella sp. NPDC051586 TaxID=3364118 RepID=UPI0037A02680